MDRRQLDALSRALGTPGDRRTLLTLLGSGLGMLTLAGMGSPEAEAKKKKKERRRRQRRNKRQERRRRRRKNREAYDVCASGCDFTTIQAALDAVQNGATLRLHAETYGETIEISRDVTLIGSGDGAEGTILDGQGNGSVISVPALGNTQLGATVRLEGLRITGGNGGNIGGGGIINSGTLTLTGCTVTGNETNSVGGGVFINDNGSATLTNSNVTNNVAGGSGGGIFKNSSGPLALTDSSVTGNEGGGRGGGGIDTDRSSVTLTGCSVMDNRTSAWGGGLHVNSGTVTLTDTSVTGNTADQGGGIHAAGGIVMLTGTSSVADNNPDNCTNGGGTYEDPSQACAPSRDG